MFSINCIHYDLHSGRCAHPLARRVLWLGIFGQNALCVLDDDPRVGSCEVQVEHPQPGPPACPPPPLEPDGTPGRATGRRS